MRRSFIRLSTLVKMGRGAENVTERASNALLESLQQHGYCYVQHPFIQKEILDQLHRDSRIFFERYILATPSAARPGCVPLSEDERRAIATPNGFRGHYRYVGASGAGDAMECFSIGREVPNVSALRAAYGAPRGLPVDARGNPWDALLAHPAAAGGDAFMADYREMMLAYYDLCAEVALDVLRHVSCGLGIRPAAAGGPDGGDVDFFSPFHNKLDCDLQAKYYPPAPTAAMRLDTHKDLSTVTLLAQDARGGLEVWDDAEEKYVAVPVLHDALLVNAGVFLEKWTGGLLEATPHRVRSVKGGESRCSVVFFCLPNHDALVEPLLQQDDNPSVDAQDGFYAGDLMPVLDTKA